MQVLTVTFQPLLNDTRDLFILVNNYFCQLLLFNYYLIHCSIFIQCLVFIVYFIVHPVKYSALILECILGIRSPQQHSSNESINIIHQTAPSLS
jgi:hypothetical protein